LGRLFQLHRWSGDVTEDFRSQGDDAVPGQPVAGTGPLLSPDAANHEGMPSIDDSSPPDAASPSDGVGPYDPATAQNLREPGSKDRQETGHGYDLSSLVSENDTDIVHGFASAMREAEAEQRHVEAAVRWYNSHTAQLLREQEDLDMGALKEAEAWARRTYGYEFQANVSLGESCLNSMPPVVSDAIINARTEDGTPLLNHPEGIRWLMELARGGGRAAPKDKGRDEELLELRTLMAQPNSKYHKGPEAAKLQARYRDLVGGESSTPQPSKRYDSLLTKVGNEMIPSDMAGSHELAQLREKMKTKAWFKDEKSQRRYRQLIRMRDGG
jgi:hypothetical protein